MPSRSATEARPVRKPARSRLRCSTALSIWVVSVCLTGAEFDMAILRRNELAWADRNQCADGFAECDPLKVPLLGQLEDDEGKVVVHAQADGRRVHYF